MADVRFFVADAQYFILFTYFSNKNKEFFYISSILTCFSMVFIEKKLQKRSLGKLNYNTDQDTNRNCTVYVNTDTDSDSLCLHTPVCYGFFVTCL